MNTALRIDHSLNKLGELIDNGAEKVTISGLSTDAGSRKTREGLV